MGSKVQAYQENLDGNGRWKSRLCWRLSCGMSKSLTEIGTPWRAGIWSFWLLGRPWERCHACEEKTPAGAAAQGAAPDDLSAAGGVSGRFAQGHLNLLILVGAGGLAKSRSVRAVLDGQACWIEGNATPFGMYAKLYRHRDQFVVIDDVDALYADRSGVRLLKCLCQTEDEKSVAWHSDARSLKHQGIPREFVTKSRVAIIANDWRTLDKNVAALQDRGHVILFQPGAAEVHKKAGMWFDDQEVYQWFAANLHRVREPSLRHYVRERTQGGRHGLDHSPGKRGGEPAGPAGGRALGQPTYGSTAARVQAFVEQGGGCRATFFNYRRKLGNGSEGLP